jgi:hypothetical protein
MKTKTRSIIKKQCKECNKMIRNNHIINRTDVEQKINLTMSYFFDNSIDIEDPSIRYELKENRCFILYPFICSADLYVCESLIFINFYKRTADWGIKNGKAYNNSKGQFIKRLSLANFLFKYCDKMGLILLEKIMFELS